jgi:hypothetical protein
VEFGDFHEQFTRVHDGWNAGRVDTAAASAEIARLRSLLPGLPESDRAIAEFNLNDFEAALKPEAQDRMARAAAALEAANVPDGTVDERIARVEAGLREVTAIGMESDNPNEQHAIIEMNESLATLLDLLQAEKAERG